MRAGVLLIAAGCGRLGFSANGGDGTVDARDVTDASIDVPVDAQIGEPCTADVQCGKCARCDGICRAEPVVEMFVGHRSTCYVGAGGRRWCTGENNEGQLGLGDTTNRLLPTRATDGDGWDRINLFYYGEALGVRQGMFFQWGNGTLTPVAMGPARDVRATLGDLRRQCFWELDGTSGCPGSGTTVWRSLDYGAGHYCGVRASDRSLWCWGTSYSNALGIVVADATVVATPTRVGTDTDWDHVGVGGKDAGPTGLVGVTCAMKTNGTVYCFGHPSLTGTNGTDVGATPTAITGSPWSWVDVDWQHACAGKSDGSVWCWGADTYGGYVIPGAMSAAVPTAIPGTYQRWLMGGHHACGLTNGMWRCMGWNEQGQLGDGTTSGTGELVDFCPAQ